MNLTKPILANDISVLPRIILGSSSPRRQSLLSQFVPFEVISPDIEEIPEYGENPASYTLRNAVAKAAAAAARVDGSRPGPVLVITCDTIVVLDGEILEKPVDGEHAFDMLTKLSDRTHTVISGVCIRRFDKNGADHRIKTFTVETKVKIKLLDQAEIRAYVATGEPMDKAGAYAAQGIGSYMVERIEGSYSNVVGLPMCELIAALKEDFEVPLW